jgi:hypothetical protein
MPHFPGHLREAFSEAVGDWPAALADTDDLFHGRVMRAWWSDLSVEQRGRYLAGKMHLCTDIMPSGVCADLDLPPGSTFGRGARKLWPTVAAVKLPRRPDPAFAMDRALAR